MIQFDWTINIMALLAILGGVSGALYFILKIDYRVTSVSNDVQSMNKELQKITEVIVIQGRQDERITAMDQRMVNQGKRIDDVVRRLNTYLDMRAANAFEDQDD